MNFIPYFSLSNFLKLFNVEIFTSQVHFDGKKLQKSRNARITQLGIDFKNGLGITSTQ